PNDEGRASSIGDGRVPSSRTYTSQMQASKVDLPSVRRSSRSGKLPVMFNDYVVESKVKYGLEKHVNHSKLNAVNYCFATIFVELETYYNAIKHNNWVEAMNKEIKDFNRNNTWNITNLLVGRKPIGCKWLYKINTSLLVKLIYKARLVAKKYSEREGIEFDETFSHVVKMDTVKNLMSLVVHYNWPLYQIDVKNAFLYSDLYENVYMTLPLGFGNDNGN
ncbi:ribonuclease H-like domain-containing protein, partial [Tanacetum coccineum]